MANGELLATPLEPISVRIREASRLTGLSRSKLYELMGAGDIEFAKVGSSRLILVESLRRLVETRRVPRGQSELHAEEAACSRGGT